MKDLMHILRLQEGFVRQEREQWPKKKLAYNPKGMSCTFCKEQDSHEEHFCLARPTKPTPENANKWADKLIWAPEETLEVFEGLSLTEALAQLTERATELNKGNPWRNDLSPKGKLRRYLGWWKGIGASSVVLSWIAYGLPFGMFRKPPRLRFKNTQSAVEEMVFCKSEADHHLKEGHFGKVEPSYPEMMMGLLVQKTYKGLVEKLRNCHNGIPLNAYLANHKHKFETTQEHVPTIIERMMKLFSIDLKKAYYLFHMAPE